MTAKAIVSEKLIHKAIMQWVRLNPDISPYVMHIPNEGPRTSRYGAELKAMGLMPGAADLFIALPRSGYHGAWIELKTTIGKLTPAQSDFLERMKTENYYTAVVRDIDFGIALIKTYCAGAKDANIPLI